MQFIKKPSPNFSNRDTNIINMIIIHNISLPPKDFNSDYIIDFFQNKLNINKHPYFKKIKKLEVSAHLLIKRKGDIIQFVDFEKKAWHAGESCYKEYTNINQNSIGIELEGSDDINYTKIQYQKLNEVLKYLLQIYPIKYIVGHCDIAPNRKTDPGKSFRWDKILNGNIHKYR